MRRYFYLLLVFALGLSGCEPPPGNQIPGEEVVLPPPITEAEMAEQLVQDARASAIQAVDSINREMQLMPSAEPIPPQPEP